MAMVVREAEIKAAFIQHLRQQGRLGVETVLANEFRIGRTGVRADLAFTANALLTCIEIKSDGDSLKRFVKQTSSYRAYSDRVIVVLAARHLRSIDGGLLEGLEVWEITSRGKLLQRRKGRVASSANAPPLEDLLTQREREMLLGKRYNVECPGQRRAAFLHAFHQRYQRKSELLWRAAASRPVEADDLSLLSRFRERRDLEDFIDSRNRSIWTQWEGG